MQRYAWVALSAMLTLASPSFVGAQPSTQPPPVKSFRVVVLGEVKKPGIYPIDAATPVLEALTLAGGTTDRADLPAAYVIRGDKELWLDLRKLIQGGDLSVNIALQPGDTVVVPQVSVGANPHDQRIYILGQVQRPGVHTIKKNVPILHAIFLAGGLTEGADLPSAFIVRGAERIPVNLWQLIQKGDLSQNIEVKRGDTIVVPVVGEMQNAIAGSTTDTDDQRPGAYNNKKNMLIFCITTFVSADLCDNWPNRMKDPQKYQPLQPGDVLIVPERLF